LKTLINEPTVASVQTATVSKQKDIISTLVLAFSTDPIVRWMYPQPQQYLTYFPNFVKAFAGQAFDTGTAYYVNGYAGTALWFSPGVELNEAPLIALLQESISESRHEQIFAILEQISEYHPNQPHWYLPLIGVEPTQQSKGYGSALIEQVLRRCDRDQIPAYLESSNPDNFRFYERHGFEQLATIQVGDSPPIYPMLRHPNHDY
jgi:ribosomal protein S18 acetylase RimI-like enzyme